MSRATRRNAFGLGRDIPAPIRRTVRQECRFGCIFCGHAIYQYEHIVPFSKVRDHIPRNIALLCGTCHDQVTRRIIAKDAVRAKRLDPYRLSRRWPRSSFYPNAERFPVVLGGARFISPRTALRVLGRDLLSIREPECNDGPIRLSAEFCDDGGETCLTIEDNECKLNPGSWDIEAKGARFTIRRAPRNIALRIRLLPDQLTVERLAMQYRGVKLEANERELKIFASARQSYQLAGWVNSPDVGIEINQKAPCSVIEVKEPVRRINLLGSGGDYTIAGRQPPNTEISFWGGARSLTMNADANVTVGGTPPTQDLGLALSTRAAMSLGLGDLEVLIGAGARAHDLSLG